MYTLVPRQRWLGVEQIRSASDNPIIFERVDLQQDLTPEVLKAELPTLEGGVQRQSKSTVFYYSAKKPLAAVRSFHERPAYVMKNMSAAQLLHNLKASASAAAWDEALVAPDRCSRREWWYYSAPNSTEAMAVARRHVDIALLERAVTSIGAGDDAATEVHSINLWVGGAGVVAASHYDASINLFVQLHGRKRFLLTAPEAEASVAPYSFLHPHFRRAQQPPQSVGEHWLSVADLWPGDMLFLPKSVWHYVRSLTTSVSVNFWF